MKKTCNGKKQLRLGRISYLNVLPVYHALESGLIEHDYEIVSGPPALLNDMMAAGELHVSSCSCFEYARRPERYYLGRDLSIGSNGPVMSVLLLSKVPFENLEGSDVLISGESHTSAALLKLLLKERYGVIPAWRVGAVSSALRKQPPDAFLAIGDEALRLRAHPEYPWRLDLAEAWREWTGLPFIFGLWVLDSGAVEAGLFRDDPAALLRAGRDWGLSHMDVILDLTGHGCPLSREELKRYYEDGLVFGLGEKEQAGLRMFYEKLAACGMIARAPELRFFGD